MVRTLGGAPSFVIGEQGWIIEGQPAPVVRGTYVTNADAIADPVIESDHIFGPNLPTRSIGFRSTFRLANGIELSGRAEYVGGELLARQRFEKPRAARAPGLYAIGRIRM